VTNEYNFKDFGLTLPTGTKISEIANQNSPFGKVWANFLHDLEAIGGHVVAGTITGAGVNNLAIPTKLPAGVA